MTQKIILAITFLFIWQCNCIRFNPFAKVERMTNENLNCGRSQLNPLVEHSRRGLEGVYPTRETYPWMVLIRSSKAYCAGALLPSTIGNMSAYALSTVSCLLHLSESDLTTIKLIAGVVNVLDDDETSRQEVKIVEMIRISDSKKDMAGLMLLALSKPIVYNDYARPICLPDGERIQPGDECVLTFWNRKRLGESLKNMPRSILPQNILLTIARDDICKAAKDFDSAKFICIKDAHTVDFYEWEVTSGAPLVCKENGYWILQGFGGLTYTNKWTPTRFVRVSNYKNKLIEKLNLSAKK